jgi:hypothetical protein
VNISIARTIYYGARQLGSSVGVTCAVILIDRRLSLHTATLLDAFINRNFGVIGINDRTVLPNAIHSAIRTQAFVLTYADVFYVMASIAFSTIFLIPVLPSFKSAAGVANAAADLNRTLRHEKLA